MTAAEQYARLGAGVENDGELVIVSAGKETIAMTLEQAKRFAFYFARACQDANYLQRHPRVTAFANMERINAS